MSSIRGEMIQKSCIVWLMIPTMNLKFLDMRSSFLGFFWVVVIMHLSQMMKGFQMFPFLLQGSNMKKE